MSTKFEKLLSEIAADTVVEEGQKPKPKTFNKKAFDETFTALVNSPDYEVETAVKDDTQAEGYRIEKSQPVKEFRKSFESLLVDAGVDKVEAAHQAHTAELKTLTGSSELISEAVYQYLKAGKRFTFNTQPDFQANLVLQDVEAGSKPYNNPQTGEKGLSKFKKHKKLKVSSTAPDWLKDRLD